jgi:hypothetical protein
MCTRQTRSTRSTPAADGNTAVSSNAVASAHQLSIELAGSAIPPTTLNHPASESAPANNVLTTVLAALCPEERERVIISPEGSALASAADPASEGNTAPATPATHVASARATPAPHIPPAALTAYAAPVANVTNPAIASNLKEILENCFQPENIIKLSTSFSPSARRRETVTLRTLIIPTTEKDRYSQDYRGGLPSFMQPLGHPVHAQPHLHF